MGAQRMNLFMCGQLGTGCTEIAQIVSSRLDMTVFNTEKLLHHLAADLELSFTQLATKATSGEVELDESLSSLVSSFIRDKHVERLIVEGRTAFMVLLEPATLKVLLVAPEYVRAYHIAQRRDIDYEKAREATRISDEDRAQLVRRLWKVDWLDPSLYDLVINTGAWSYDQAAGIIETALRNRSGAKEV
ncbi:MAG: cytidylate kinase family protein [Candidatus Brockarchaeota archaeon]|nr:cytidylate kinase family protein [Candidatus Brockarchaeota archaeon]